ncbi:MAG: type transporter [Bacteroidetes bacterium]|nr:type transporter [Bacteroidota bacterium]
MSHSFFSAVTKTLRRELQRMKSRPLYFICTVGVMSFCFLFFLTLFSPGQPTAMPIAIVDHDQTPSTRSFIRNLSATQQVKVVMQLNNQAEARKEMQKGNIYAFVEVKHGFTADAIANRRPTIVFYVNDTYLIAGSLLYKDISYMSALASASMQQKVLRAKGVNESQIMGIIQPIISDTHLIGNPWANYGVYLITLLLPGVLQLMVLLMTIFPIGVELKEKTSREWLRTANKSMAAALIGKLLPYTVIFILLGIISNILLYGFMHYPTQAGIGGMFLATIIYILAYQAIGILIIGTLPVLRDSVAMAALYGLFAFTFAGFTFPIEQMPYPVQIFSEIFPIRHYFRIYVNQALHGTSISYSYAYYLIMLAFTLLPALVFYRLKKAAIYMNYPTK